jgi:large subunit ribosomal protein L21
MVYAIVETGGKQIRVEPGRFYDIERLVNEPDEKITLDKVLFVHHGDNIEIGQPFVDGATIEATVMQHLRGRKVIVYKMRPKKKTRKKQGHRQELTRLMIDTVSLAGKALEAETKTEVEVEAKTEVKAEASS